MTEKEEVIENKTEEQEKVNVPKNKKSAKKDSGEEKMAQEKFTLRELVQKYSDVEDIFLKLTNAGYYMQYIEEVDAYKRDGIIEPSLTEKEFEKIIK